MKILIEFKWSAWVSNWKLVSIFLDQVMAWYLTDTESLPVPVMIQALKCYFS